MVTFRFNPDPNLAGNSIRQGVDTGSRLIDLVQNRRDRNALQRVGDLSANGLGDQATANQVGSELIRLGQIGAGINAQNVPADRQRLQQQQDFQQQQFQALQTQRGIQNALAARNADRTDALADSTIAKNAAAIAADEADAAASANASNQLFDGKSVEGQAFNFLVARNMLTPEQAASIAAGKDIVGANGERVFFTPQDIVNAANQVRANQPVGGEIGDPTRGISLTGPKAANQAQLDAAGFADRLSVAIPIIDKNEAAGLSFQQQATALIPVFGNALVSGDFQQLDQATRNFINATLRRESGAAIAESEFDNARRQYIPLPGDGEKALKQKSSNRKNILRSMIRAAGPTYTPPDEPAIDVPTASQVQSGQRQTATGVTWRPK